MCIIRSSLYPGYWLFWGCTTSDSSFILCCRKMLPCMIRFLTSISLTLLCSSHRDFRWQLNYIQFTWTPIDIPITFSSSVLPLTRLFLIRSTRPLRIINSCISSLLSYKNRGCTHTSTNTHGSQSNLPLLQQRQDSGILSSTSTTQRMTQSNGTSVDVQLIRGNVACLSRVQTLSSESLIDLEHINVTDSQTSLLQHTGNGHCWPMPMISGGTPTEEHITNLPWIG